jgi:hypothetical protein
VPRAPSGRAGVRPGDVIEAVDGRAVAGEADWFLARANFDRGRQIEIQVWRDESHLRLWFTVVTHNWRTYTPGVTAFALARVILLLLTLIVAFSRPRKLSASLLALILAMIAVGEAFPKAGWAGALRDLPTVLVGADLTGLGFMASDRYPLAIVLRSVSPAVPHAVVAVEAPSGPARHLWASDGAIRHRLYLRAAGSGHALNVFGFR